MKYILTPTEKGIEKGKKPLEFTNERQARFAMAINRQYYELTEEENG
jgi:hypothetical protein